MIEDGKVSIKVSVSVGLSGYPHGGSTVDAIMQKADAAMYANKHEHKVAAKPDQAGNGQFKEAVATAPQKSDAGRA